MPCDEPYGCADNLEVSNGHCYCRLVVLIVGVVWSYVCRRLFCFDMSVRKQVDVLVLGRGVIGKVLVSNLPDELQGSIS